MPHLRVSLAFTYGTDHTVEDTANAVSANLYGVAAYPTPPVLKTALDAGTAAFTAALAAQEQGGTAATAAKNDQRDELIALLRQLAHYVEDNCNDDLATLLASGFQAVGGGASPTPSIIPAPTIGKIKLGTSGQLILSITAIANAHGYQVRFAAIGAGGTPGPWQDGGTHTNSRSMPVGGLTPGTTYVFQVRTIGAGSGNYSDWSDAVQHMSM